MPGPDAKNSRAHRGGFNRQCGILSSIVCSIYYSYIVHCHKSDMKRN